MRGVTFTSWLIMHLQIFQLTRLMRGVTQTICNCFNLFIFQLTRLMRGVTMVGERVMITLSISTHTPHARRDGKSFGAVTAQLQFQLTRLMRGVTYRWI